MKRENEIERDNRYQPFKGRDGDENDGEETWESEKWSTRPNTRFGVGKRNGGTIRLEVTGRRREEYEKRGRAGKQTPGPYFTSQSYLCAHIMDRGDWKGRKGLGTAFLLFRRRNEKSLFRRSSRPGERSIQSGEKRGTDTRYDVALEDRGRTLSSPWKRRKIDRRGPIDDNSWWRRFETRKK